MRELDEQYAEYLEKQKQSYQDAGKLKAMLAVSEELRWLKDKPVEDNPSQVQRLSSFTELKRLQEIYRERWAEVEDQSAFLDKKLALIQRCRKKAELLAATWTKEGKIESAKLALAQSERFAVIEKDAELVAKAARTAITKAEGGFAGRNAGEEMKNGVKMTLSWIPAGEFTMGSPLDEPEREEEREAQVEVELSVGFWMGKYEVTQREYERITGNNPARFQEAGNDAPLEKVSWEEAVAFCKELNGQEQKQGLLPEGWAYTLPTEAQWEYACRAGEKGPYSGGPLEEVAWYRENSGGTTHKVGEKKANAWGLHDMHGNVREWCLDWMADELSGGKDPEGPVVGSERVHRGGAWGARLSHCRTARRKEGPPDLHYFGIGFRICLSPIH